MSTVEEKRTRKPAARHKDVILAAIDERLAVMIMTADIPMQGHIERLYVLMDELQRSLKKEE